MVRESNSHQNLVGGTPYNDTYEVSEEKSILSTWMTMGLMLIVVIAFSATNRRFRFTSRSLAIITALLASCSPANAAGGFADLISPPFCFLDDDPVIVGQRYMDFHHLEVILYAFVISFFAVLILFLMLATASSLLLAIFYFFFPGASPVVPFQPDETITRVATAAQTTSSFFEVGDLSSKVHAFTQVIETIITLRIGTWHAIALRLTNVFSEYFTLAPSKLFAIVERYFRKVRACFPPQATASGLFGDIGDALGSLDWISTISGWHGALRHLLAHLLALPFLHLEHLLEDFSFLDLIDTVSLESLRKGSSLVRVENFIKVLQDFCIALDTWIDPKEGDAAFLLNLRTVQGWARNIEYLESMIGKRSRVAKAGFITYAAFNLQVSQCELRKASHAVSGPYNMIVSEAMMRLRNCKAAQMSFTHPDTTAPFVFGITGVSGIGKSEAAKQWMRNLMRKVPEYEGLDDETLNNMIFLCTPTSKWMYEGYLPERHQCVIFEEIGTIITPNNPIHPQILKVMEHGAHQTDQASAALKGKVPFTAKFIAVVSNDCRYGLDVDPKESGIANRAAWYRRFDLHVDGTGVKSQFLSSDGRTPGIDIPQTLSVANWRLMTTEGVGDNVWPVPVMAGNRVQTLSFLEVATIADQRFALVRAKAHRMDRLSTESLDFYACNIPRDGDGGETNIRRYDCECCERCPLCAKTVACAAIAVCCPDCRWHVPLGGEPVHQITAASFMDVRSWGVFVHTYGIFSGSARYAVFAIQRHFAADSPFTAVGTTGYVTMAFWAIAVSSFSILGWTLPLTPMGLGISSVIWTGMALRPSQLSNSVHDTIADGFDLVFAVLPVSLNMPLHLAYYASNMFKFLSALSCGMMFSSVSLYTSASIGLYLFGVPLTFPFSAVAYMGVYTAVCLRGFYNNPRFFGRNSSLNDWYHSRRLREIGLDPASVHAGFTMVFVFLGAFAGLRYLQSVESPPSQKDDTPDEPHSQTVVKASASAQRPKLPFSVPFCDVFHVRESMWGNKQDGIVWQASQVPLTQLRAKIKANQVRLVIRARGSTTYVGGTYVHSNCIASVYHALRDLLSEGSTLTVYKRVNDVFTKVLDEANYTKDGVSTLPALTVHLEQTKDIVAISTGGNASISLAKYFVRAAVGSMRFRAVVIYMTKSGEVKEVFGHAQESQQTVVMDGTSEKLYQARFFDFTPESGVEFSSFPGICGGMMVAYSLTHCGIVGVLAATFTVERGDKIIYRVAALPVIQSGVDFSKFGTATPASFPETLCADSSYDMALDPPFQSPNFHSTHAKEKGRLEEMYGATEIMGTKADAVVHAKPSVEWYKWHQEIFKEIPEFIHDSIPPIMRGCRGPDGTYVSPGSWAIRDLREEVSHYSLPYHYDACEFMWSQRAAHVDLFDLYDLVEYHGDVSTCMSGVHGSALFTGVKRRTGAGYPYPGVKADYMTFNEDGTVGLQQRLLDDIDRVLEAYACGRRQGFITRGTYKNEPRAASKVALRKIRLFAPVSLDKLMVSHILTAPLVQISVLMRKPLMTLGGMSVFSEEWAELRKTREDSKPNVIPGDFVKFDKSTSHQALMSTRQLDMRCIHAGRFYKSLSDSQKATFDTMYHTYASDSANALLIVDGECLNPGHSTSSGGADTYKQNCDTHNMYAGEAIHIIIEKVSDDSSSYFLDQSVDKDAAFALAQRLRGLLLGDRLAVVRESLDIITHGDDGLYAVSDEFVTLFNFHSFQQAYAAMNLGYTPADKSGASFSHVTWDDADLGKRKFVRNEELDTYLAPLAIKSIGKMLTIGVKSDMSLHEKREEAVVSALMEFAQYGREQYDDWVQRLTPICEKWGVALPAKDWLTTVSSNRTTRTSHARGEDQTTVAKLETALATMLGTAPEA